MTHDLDTLPGWDDLKAAGDVPAPSPKTLARAHQRLGRSAPKRVLRARVLAPGLAVTAIVAVVAGGIAVQQNGSSQRPAAGGQPSETVPSTTTVPSEKPTQGIAASCAFRYSPAELMKSGFAFDGTALTIVRDPDGSAPSYLVTLQVHEWFRPVDGPRKVTVRTYKPPVGSDNQVSVDFPDYKIGSRLLMTGAPQWGGTDPLRDAVAWGCGFSRAYNPADAATWRQILKK